MKKILVPTDFSKNAYNALNFAIAFANTFGSEITLLHTFKLYSSTGMFVSVESYMEDDAQEDLATMIKTTRPKLKNGATISHKLFRGDAAPVISAVAEKQEYDLIIMGTQGASGLKEVFTGSTTNGVIKTTRVPVLTIPEGYNFSFPKTIVFAIDHDEISKANILDPLVSIAQKFKAKIEIFHQNTGSTDKGIPALIRQYFDPLEASYHFRLDRQNIHAGINDFVTEMKADILCMVRRKRSFLEKIFHQSVTTEESFHSKVPLLILQDPGE